MVAQGLLVALYVNYDRKRLFLPQFKENVRKIDGMLTGIEGTIAEISYHKEDIAALEQGFKDTVDDYLEFITNLPRIAKDLEKGE